MSKQAQRGILSRFSTLAGAALLVALAACSDQLGSPAAREPQARGAKLLPVGGRLVSNSVKYRNTGAPHATGRSGSARLEGAALLGTDGVTRLTITTGSLDDPSRAPGEIARAQIKVFGTDGTLLFVQNHNKLTGGGTQTFLLHGLSPDARVQVQANVRGIDRNRTDVVTLTGAVMRAPALNVEVELPPQATTGEPVVVTGVVSEINGDVGTRGNCELWVDGRLVDQAQGIWVDAGDAVTCAFTHRFPGEGSYDVEVRVGDSSDGGVIVVGSAFTTSYTASAEDSWVNTTTVLEYTWWRPDGSHKEYSNAETTRHRMQTISARGTLSRAVAFPLAAVELSVTSGGGRWHEERWTGLASIVDPQGRACASRDVPLQSALFYVCNDPAGGASWGYQRFGGRVTYHSRGYSNTFDVRDGTDAVYSWNDGYTTSESGAQIRNFEGGVTLQLTIRDLAGSFTITPVIPQSPFANPLTSTPRTCEESRPYWLEGGVLTTCTSASSDEAGTRGETTG